MNIQLIEAWWFHGIPTMRWWRWIFTRFFEFEFYYEEKSLNLFDRLFNREWPHFEYTDESRNRIVWQIVLLWWIESKLMYCLDERWLTYLNAFSLKFISLGNGAQSNWCCMRYEQINKWNQFACAFAKNQQQKINESLLNKYSHTVSIDSRFFWCRKLCIL